MDENSPLGRVKCGLRTGEEKLRKSGRDLKISLLDFWRWSSSDLLSNTARGIFAEFVVAAALGIPFEEIRDEWAPYDLETPEGIKVEVKSAAFIQSWHQTAASKISFVAPKKRSWNPETNKLETEIRRHADVYVFALLFEQQSVPDPLNLDHWEFYVLPTAVLNARTESQRSINLRSLHALSGGPVSYDRLKDAVKKADKMNTGEHS